MLSSVIARQKSLYQRTASRGARPCARSAATRGPIQLDRPRRRAADRGAGTSVASPARISTIGNVE